MTSPPEFTKVLEGIANTMQMHELMARVPDCPVTDLASGRAWIGQWFEIEQSSYEMMFDLLPPLFMRHDMFAMPELKAGFVGSVFFCITICGQRRWFHGYCNLGDRHGPDAMRAAIVAYESRLLDGGAR